MQVGGAGKCATRASAMATRRLPGMRVQVRRGQRRDLTRLRAFLEHEEAGRRTRFDRRLLADLGTDVYLAEDDGGAIVGVVAVAYLRSLAAGAFAAVLDTARAAGSEAPQVLCPACNPPIAGHKGWVTQRTGSRCCDRQSSRRRPRPVHSGCA